jgi:hypothetical protein
VALPISLRGASSRSMNTNANADCELSGQRLARSRENSLTGSTVTLSAASACGSIYFAKTPSIHDFRCRSRNARLARERHNVYQYKRHASSRRQWEGVSEPLQKARTNNLHLFPL